MTEDQLRALVREVVAERLGAPAPASAGPGSSSRLHPSHGLMRVAPGAEAGGMCLIEPVVRCNLCGFCQSYGH
jgi:hypothetical protein